MILIALLCLVLDPQLETVQRFFQGIVVILLPYLGAAFILKLVYEHSPEVVLRFFIPWPFKNMIVDKELIGNGPGTNGEEVPGAHCASRDSSSHTSESGGSD